MRRHLALLAPLVLLCWCSNLLLCSSSYHHNHNHYDLGDRVNGFHCPRDLSAGETLPELWCNQTWNGTCYQECNRTLCDCSVSSSNDSGAPVFVDLGDNRTVAFVSGCLNWPSAQSECCNAFGGRLWEPTGSEELAAATAALEEQFGSAVDNCTWWIGGYNCQRSWRRGSSLVFAASSAGTEEIPGLLVLDGPDRLKQNCVVLNGANGTLADWNCGCTAASYACEVGGNVTMPPVNSTTTQMPPTNTTMPPTNTTMAPTNTTMAPTNTTMSPTNTTMAPTNTTMAPANTTTQTP